MSISAQNWRIDGEYFESCNCTLLCPCLLTHATVNPTEGHCDVVLAIHVQKGNYGNVDISGLNAAQALTTPGPMANGGGDIAVYVDHRANDAQRAALEAIFTGDAGGPPSLVMAMASRRLPAKSVAIDYISASDVKKVSIRDIGEVTVEGVAGANGQVVWLENVGHPFSTRLAAARGSTSHFKDHGLAFDNTGRNGHYSAISWSNG